MVITVNKAGNGSEATPFRPDTTAKNWNVIAETEDEFTIEILEE